MDFELEAAIENWQRATERLVSIVRGIEPGRWPLPSPYPGWTNKDLLAHLACGYTERIALLRRVLMLGRPDQPRPIDLVNAEQIEARRRASVEDLLAEMFVTRGRVLGLMEQLQDVHLDAIVDFGATPTRLGSALREFSHHDLAHAEDLAPLRTQG